MRKYIIHRGSASIGFIIVLSLSAFLISALGHGNIQPSPVATKKADTWWSEQEKKVSKQYTTEQSKTPGLSTENTGLKDPDDINWPYGEEFTYKLAIRSEIKNEIDIPIKSELNCTVDFRDSGGSFDEAVTVKDSYARGSIGADATFVEHHKIKNLTMYIEMVDDIRGADSETPRVEYYFEVVGDTTQLQANIPPEESMFFPGPYQMEFNTPADGYFYLTGADTPGFTALLLSSVDLDKGKQANVWIFNPSFFLLFGENEESMRDPEDFLTYVTISDLNECPEETKEWWENSRKYFNNWKPSLGVRTIIFEGNTDTFYPFYDDSWYFAEDADIPDTYMPYGPFAVAYVDEEGRMIRFEQPGGFLCKTATLEDIETGKPWWGEKDEE